MLLLCHPLDSDSDFDDDNDDDEDIEGEYYHDKKNNQDWEKHDNRNYNKYVFFFVLMHTGGGVVSCMQDFYMQKLSQKA